MKKFLALALCALMVLTMSAVVFAAEDNAFEYNFEDDTEGDFIAIDNSIKFYPKQGSVEIVKFDGSMVAKISQIDLQDIGGQMDTYLDLVAGPVSTYGVEQQYVLEYDVYFEKFGPTTQWQILCSRETPAAGTQFQNVGYFKGNEAGTIDLEIVKTVAEGETNDPVATFETGKWMKVAACIDKKNACFSVYVDGVCYAKDMDYTVADGSAAESERIRTAFAAAGAGSDAIAYLDNIKIYNATTPRDVKVATPTTSAAPATEAPVVTEAPSTGAATTPAPSEGSSTATADIAVVIAAVAAVAASGAVIVKKKH
ncbi:MAG: hypothetical protein ACI3XP_03215 [Eubacteriales bacterium]